MKYRDASTEAIKFALTLPTWETYDFLQMWSDGDFPELREGWPEAPESVYIGADPLHPETAKLQAADEAKEARGMELEEQVKKLAFLLSEHVNNDQMEWDEDDWIERSARAIYDIDFDEQEQPVSATASDEP